MIGPVEDRWTNFWAPVEDSEPVGFLSDLPRCTEELEPGEGCNCGVEDSEGIAEIGDRVRFNPEAVTAPVSLLAKIDSLLAEIRQPERSTRDPAVLHHRVVVEKIEVKP